MIDTTDKDKIGVILLNLGGPDSLDAVKPFLYNLFSDSQIIKLGPPFLQKPLALLIATTRAKKTKKFYSLVGGKSPILDITLAQARALEELLNKQNESENRRIGEKRTSEIQSFTDSPSHRFTVSPSFRVYVGMRYWHPFIGEVIPEIYNSGIRRLIALSLYPHYSIATSGSSLSKFKEVAAEYPIEFLSICSWFDHPLYIEALVDVIKKGLKSFSLETSGISATDTDKSPLTPFTEGGLGGITEKGGKGGFDDIHILFSAHSLPQKMIDEGDPYVNQIMATIGEITKRLQIEWHLSYQSRSGPVKWLEPSTDEEIKRLAKEGIRNILVVPISFVSDHIETLYEIDILYKNLAEGLGVALRRVDSLNTHPVFIEALKDMVQRIVKEAGWV